MKTCAACGYLAVRRTDDASLMEASKPFRQNRAIPLRIIDPPTNAFEEIPVCFLQRISIRAECNEKTDSETVLQIIHKNRTACSGFTPWRQGYSPKDHADRSEARKRRNREEQRRQKELDEARQLRLEDRKNLRETIIHVALLGIAALFLLLAGMGKITWLMKE